MTDAGWRFWIDRGGTFTDCVGLRPDGTRCVTKVLSSDDAALVAIRALVGIEPGEAFPRIDEVRVGTTVATNALLERRGARTALITSTGLEDLLEIGDTARPALFALDIEKPRPLAERAVGVCARGTADGQVLYSVDPEATEAAIRALAEAGIESLAVALLHGVRVPELEVQVGEIARRWFSNVTLSHRVGARAGLLARAQTTVLDAYLTPVLRTHVERLAEALPVSTRLFFMQSSGALVERARFFGRDAVLSGPAGGAVAVGAIASRHGVPRAIGFDMGGTSTDVCRWEGEPARRYEADIAGVRLQAPMIAIHTVAAGGGSVCTFDGRRLRVGPKSAGADPGPAAYGRAEAPEPTLTDVNVVLGRLIGDRFAFSLDRDAARRAVAALAAEAGRSVEEIADGLLRIANANMADAVRRVTTALGHDVADHALVAFGGAGGQHVCAIARALEIETVLIHPLDGVLSAYGIGTAPRGWHGEADLRGQTLEETNVAGIERALASLEDEGRAILGSAARARRALDVRYSGTDVALTVEVKSPLDAASVRARFDTHHLALNGFARRDAHAEVTIARVSLEEQADLAREVCGTATGPRQTRTARVFMDGGYVDGVPVFDRESLGVGVELRGPALVLSAHASLVLEHGWTLRVADDGTFVLARAGLRGPERIEASREGVDPASLELFANAFASIASEMGEALRRGAQSTNIRERLDFSCALFDGDGELVANAPHIPVHLGAMGETVRAIRAAYPKPEEGEVFASNHPAYGGSHLPDITVVSPVFIHGTLRFYVASRGHHADIGSMSPGSMPSDSRRLAEEGAVLDRLRIVQRGVLDRDRLLSVLLAGPHGARHPEQNIADIEAQVAANHRGIIRLRELVDRSDVETVSAYMAHVTDDAARAVERVIAAMPDGMRSFVDALDDGAEIRVQITVRGSAMVVDFEGTAPEQRESNLNAPRAVTVAALIYCLRCLVDASIPLNAGCLRPVRLRIPAGSLLSPAADCAVAGGNVETSQRVVDVLLGAFGVVAASQGTMNNLTFGDATFGYYETIGGGAGAGPTFDGASGVQTHMTNTRITDPEILEDRYPVRLRRFEIRRKSGGDGARRGGDGLIREIEARKPLTFSILSQRRSRAPYGLRGGEPGEVGRTRVGPRELGACETIEVSAGESVIVMSPGGGGYGAPER